MVTHSPVDIERDIRQRDFAVTRGASAAAGMVLVPVTALAGVRRPMLLMGDRAAQEQMQQARGAGGARAGVGSSGAAKPTM